MSTLRVSAINNAAASSGGLAIDSSGVVTGGLPSPNRNLLYNGAMQVAQRGTSTASITSSGYYTADRWYMNYSSIGTWTQSVEADGPSGSGLTKSLKMLCTTADSSLSAGDNLQIWQALEGQDVQRVAKGTASAQQLTISFWVKSNVTGTYIAELFDQDNTRSISASYTIDASATWERKTITFAADGTGALDNDNSSSLTARFWLGAGSTYTSGTLQSSWDSTTTANRAVGQTNLASATNNYWQVTGVQLEVGPTATPFEFKSYGRELAECQRYYEVTDTASSNIFAVGGATSVSYLERFQVVKRASPTITYIGGSASVSVSSQTIYGAIISRSSTSLYTGVTASSEL